MQIISNAFSIPAPLPTRHDQEQQIYHDNDTKINDNIIIAPKNSKKTKTGTISSNCTNDLCIKKLDKTVLTNQYMCYGSKRRI